MRQIRVSEINVSPHFADEIGSSGWGCLRSQELPCHWQPIGPRKKTMPQPVIDFCLYLEGMQAAVTGNYTWSSAKWGLTGEGILCILKSLLHILQI